MFCVLQDSNGQFHQGTHVDGRIRTTSELQKAKLYRVAIQFVNDVPQLYTEPDLPNSPHARGLQPVAVSLQLT